MAKGAKDVQIFIIYYISFVQFCFIIWAICGPRLIAVFNPNLYTIIFYFIFILQILSINFYIWSIYNFNCYSVYDFYLMRGQNIYIQFL